MAKVSFLIAFFGGVLSFASPCVLPLIPSYLSLITGLTIKDLSEGKRSAQVEKVTIINSLLFILGFSIVFVSFGAAASAVGRILYQYKNIIRIAGGSMVILLGFYVMGLLKLHFLDLERRFNLGTKPTSYFSSLLVGVVFASAWTPCVGPILASILTLAAASETLWSGVLLLIFYSLGLGVPFFLSSLALDSFLIYSKKVRKYMRAVTLVSGSFLIVAGVLLLTDYFQAITTYLIAR